MSLSDGEQEALLRIGSKLKAIEDVLISDRTRFDLANIRELFKDLALLKERLGNINNDISFVASLLAKDFLSAHHAIRSLDMSLKPQGAPGLDVDVVTDQGERVVAEIKTTFPYGVTDLGASQKASFQRDFEKLASARARHKYFFVTERSTFDIVRRKYVSRLEGVTLVLLPDGLSDSAYAAKAAGEVSPESPSREQLSTPSVDGKLRQADAIRRFIVETYVDPARESGRSRVTIRSGDVARGMSLPGNRYPNICSAMRGRKIEALADIRVVERSGNDGANFSVTYSL